MCPFNAYAGLDSGKVWLYNSTHSHCAVAEGNFRQVSSRREKRRKRKRICGLESPRKMPILADGHFSSKEPLQSAGARASLDEDEAK
jgi:hypothetical protein